MVELSIIALASQILSAIDSRPFNEAFKRVAGSNSELKLFKDPIQAIKPYILDAEKHEENSVDLKNWVRTVREALYDVDDLFEGVTTNDQKGKGKTTLWRKVLLPSFSSIIPTVKNAAGIRERLVNASSGRDRFGLIPQAELDEGPTYGISGEHAQRSIVDPKEGYIREEDRNEIRGFLLSKNVLPVIIFGSRGIGKTTIAQLVYNDEEVQKRYDKAWWVCMSDAFDEREIYERILHAMIGKSSFNLTSTQLKAKVRGYMFSVKSFLLVLDDVWAHDFDRWMRIRTLVKIVPKGSTIMVTSRQHLDYKSTADDPAVKVHGLHKLSDHDSRKLLEWFPGSEIGAKTLDSCGHVPLAIKSLASLFYMNRDSLTYENLSQIDLSRDRQKAPLKFSYQHLHLNLKHCFAYCSLFPENYVIHKRLLIHLWIAQGFVRQDAGDQLAEKVGNLYFKELLMRSFFEEQRKDELGKIDCCKMHDLVQEVAREAAGEESIMLMKKEDTSEEENQFRGRIRHLAVGYGVDASWKIPSELLCKGRVRSVLFMAGGTLNPVAFDQLLAKFRLLRALSLEKLDLKKVPSSIKELRFLKYLNLSHNKFRHLPNSITKLPNLLTLDISGCSELELLPKSFSRLISLTHLYNSECHSLRYIPRGIGGMINLLKLGCFRVRKVVDDAKCSGINVLKKLKLRELAIRFDHDWKEDAELDWHPETLITLHIEYYQGQVLPSLPSNLVEVHLYNCKMVEDVSTLKQLHNLKNLVLFWMDNLEHVIKDQDTATSSFSSLKKLILKRLPKFKGWSRQEDDDQPLLSSLSFLKVKECPELKRMPPSEGLKTLSLHTIDVSLIEELSSSLSSSSLKDLTVNDCDGLACFRGNALTSLRRLKLLNCSHLKKVDLPPGLKPEEVETRGCPQLQYESDSGMEPQIETGLW